MSSATLQRRVTTEGRDGHRSEKQSDMSRRRAADKMAPTATSNFDRSFFVCRIAAPARTAPVPLGAALSRCGAAAGPISSGPRLQGQPGVLVHTYTQSEPDFLLARRTLRRGSNVALDTSYVHATRHWPRAYDKARHAGCWLPSPPQPCLTDALWMRDDKPLALISGRLSSPETRLVMRRLG